MSNLDHSSNQLQLSVEDEEDQDRDLEGDEHQIYSRLHSSSNFHPPVQLHGRLQGKPEVDCCQQKLPTLVASSTPMASKQQSTRFMKLGDKDQSFGQKEPRIGQKRAKGDKDEEEGYITHSIISKQKHNKVSTSRGPRDRRVRLSATTAIDFYDLQDRLGFDRPSKAIDWLMSKAKVAIDGLNNESKIAQLSYQEFESHVPSQIYHQPQQESTFPNPEYDNQNQQNFDDNPSKFTFISMICGSSSLTSMDFRNNQHVLDPRIRSQSQNLCQTIQSSQEDPTLHKEYLSTHSFGEHQQNHFSGSTPVNVNTMSSTGWFQKMISQSSNSKYCATYSSERSFEQILDQNQLFYQREPLQSTFLPSICAALTNTQLPNTDYHPMPAFNSASVTGSELAYKEFCVSPKIHCQDVAIDPNSNRSSSASSFLHYEK